MDIKKIKSLIRMVEESQVSEVSIQEGEFSIRIRKEDRNASAASLSAPQVVTLPAAPVQPAAAQPAPSTPPPAPAPQEEQVDGYVQKSPIVGTFYTAPSPDATPYVNVGDTVSKGQTLCIIEAMKIMNEIEAEVDGRVEKIVAKNATAVEYDQPLFIISTS